MATTWEILSHVIGSSILGQITVKYPEPKLDLSGRTFIVTGSNIGLGLALALHLARYGASRLILGVRSIERGNIAKEEILQQVGKGTEIEVWQLDNASFESVVAFAQKANAELPRLDGLALNAGVSGHGQWVTTEDGWEKTVQVNALAPGLLALLMLPLLNRTAKLGFEGLPKGVTDLKPHITFTGSGGQHIAKFPQKSASHILNALNDESQYVQFDRYPLSKLLDYFLVKKLSTLPLAEGVVINTVDPGLNTSEIARDIKLPLIARILIKLLAWPASKGALNILWGLTEYEGTGMFVSRRRTFGTNKWLATDLGIKVQNQIWEEEVEIWKTYAPETLLNLFVTAGPGDFYFTSSPCSGEERRNLSAHANVYIIDPEQVTVAPMRVTYSERDPYFPQELVDYIFDTYLEGSLPTNYWGDLRPTFLSCSLVCQSFLNACRNRLFNGIAFGLGSTQNTVHRNMGLLSSCDTLTVYSRLRQVVSASPHILSYVKAVMLIELVQCSPGSDTDTEAENISFLLSMLRNVSDVDNFCLKGLPDRSQPLRWTSFPAEIQQSIAGLLQTSSLTTVVFNQIEFPSPATFFSLFHASPSLDDISLIHVTCTDNDFEGVSRSFLPSQDRIRIKQFHYNADGNPQALDFMTACLEHPSSPMNMMDFANLEISAFPVESTELDLAEKLIHRAERLHFQLHGYLGSRIALRTIDLSNLQRIQGRTVLNTEWDLHEFLRWLGESLAVSPGNASLQSLELHISLDEGALASLDTDETRTIAEGLDRVLSEILPTQPQFIAELSCFTVQVEQKDTESGPKIVSLCGTAVSPNVSATFCSLLPNLTASGRLKLDSVECLDIRYHVSADGLVSVDHDGMLLKVGVQTPV